MEDQTTLTLYRRRLIPDECVLLKGDNIISRDEEKIITSWNAIHKKPDLDHGYSCYLLDKGIKVSKFLCADDSLLYWYCDIVDYVFSEDKKTLTVVDLLSDVIIYPNGDVHVVDLDELALACDQNLITVEQLKCSLKRLDFLLKEIYSGRFKIYQEYIDNTI